MRAGDHYYTTQVAFDVGGSHRPLPLLLPLRFLPPLVDRPTNTTTRTNPTQRRRRQQQQVYQDNIYQSKRPFVSARHVALSMGAPFAKQLELVTFHTASKGVYGECGFRGGVMELLNIDQRCVCLALPCPALRRVASWLICPVPSRPAHPHFPDASLPPVLLATPISPPQPPPPLACRTRSTSWRPST